MRAKKTKPSIFLNEKTSASAGSGKTHALVTRYIALAAKELDSKTGAPQPECIVALTFTRKAAGEFLRRILTRLADACLCEKSAETLISEVKLLYEIPEGAETPKGYGEKFSEILNSGKIFAILKECASNLDRLNLSTIDSFCASIIFSHANELKIFAPIKMMDDSARKAAELETMDAVLQKGAADENSFRELVQAVKMASFGMEEKSVEKTLVKIMDDCRNFYWEQPDLSRWGGEDFFDFSYPENWDGEKYLNEIAELKILAEKAELSKILESTVNFFIESSASRISSKNFPAILERVAALFTEGKLFGRVEIPYRNKSVEIPEEISALLDSLLRRLKNANLRALCRAGRALGGIARAYENEYAISVRNKGKLTFEDIALLLTDKNRSLEKSLIEERLDSNFKHWMFDEFQDTSERQWKVFENLVDEILVSSMEGENSRTIYYVGDVKQSLYSWRGGNSRLFDDIPRKYSRRELGIFAIESGKELNVSWRSGENLINAINSFFENRLALESAFTSKSADRFLTYYAPHVSAESEGLKKVSPSFARLSLVEYVSKDQARQREKIACEVFEILCRTNPPARRKSCAILVPDNDAVRFYVNYLSSRAAESGFEMRIVGDLESSAYRENLIFPVFVQILRKISHPLDSASSVYLSMTPFYDLLPKDDEEINKLLLEFSEKGFAPFAKSFSDSVLERFPLLDEYSRRYLDDLLEACAEFDSSEECGIDACVSFLCSKKVRTNPPEKTIQVMTIHKAKGLSFETVILPELHKISARVRSGMMNVGEGHVIQTPSKALSALDKKLGACMENAADDENFESICKFYVALTRAESALYIVMPELQKYETDGNISKAQFIFEAFNPELGKIESSSERKKAFKALQEKKIFTFGSEPKFEFSATPEYSFDEKSPRLKIKNPKIIARSFFAQSPSNAFGGVETRDFKKGLADDEKLLFGTFMHSIFENLRTLEAANFETEILKTKEKTSAFSEISQKEISHAESILQKMSRNAEIKKIFAEESNVFKEKSFVFLRGETLVSGVIDRLVLHKGGNSASVYDFKYFADSAESAKKYSPQLKLYKEAVSALFDIPCENIDAKIVSYSNAEVFCVS